MPALTPSYPDPASLSYEPISPAEATAAVESIIPVETVTAVESIVAVETDIVVEPVATFNESSPLPVMAISDNAQPVNISPIDALPDSTLSVNTFPVDILPVHTPAVENPPVTTMPADTLPAETSFDLSDELARLLVFDSGEGVQQPTQHEVEVAAKQELAKETQLLGGEESEPEEGEIREEDVNGQQDHVPPIFVDDLTAHIGSTGLLSSLHQQLAAPQQPEPVRSDPSEDLVNAFGGMGLEPSLQELQQDPNNIFCFDTTGVQRDHGPAVDVQEEDDEGFAEADVEEGDEEEEGDGRPDVSQMGENWWALADLLLDTFNDPDINYWVDDSTLQAAQDDDDWVLSQRAQLVSNLRRVEGGLRHHVCLSFFIHFLYPHFLDALGEMDPGALAMGKNFVNIFRPWFGSGGALWGRFAGILNEAILDVAAFKSNIDDFNEKFGASACVWFDMPNPAEWHHGPSVVVVGDPDYQGDALPVLPALKVMVGGKESVEMGAVVLGVPLRW